MIKHYFSLLLLLPEDFAFEFPRRKSFVPHYQGVTFSSLTALAFSLFIAEGFLVKRRCTHTVEGKSDKGQKFNHDVESLLQVNYFNN